jgi:uncharacterized Ntn-hydrolase superfamily protein
MLRNLLRRSRAIFAVLVFGMPAIPNWGVTAAEPPVPARSASPVDRPAVGSPPNEPKICTFSICACDPETGEVGAAVASLYPAVGKVVPYVKVGTGAFCTQFYNNAEFGPRALTMLDQGMRPEEILAELLRNDPRPEHRQLGIVDMQGRTANRNPIGAPAGGEWWGAASGKYYSVQGNTLAGRQVIVDMQAAYENTKGTLADRLMAALKAGEDAGGDHRGRLAAGIRVARPGTEGLHVELYVDKSDNAVNDLVEIYTKWKAAHSDKAKPAKPLEKAEPKP